MRVGVEDAVDHHLAQHGVEQRAGECLPVADLLVRVNRAERAAVEALHHKHIGGAQRRMRFRDPDCSGDATHGCSGGHCGHVLRLDPQVKLLAERFGEPI
jgi:hypothetical protein